ncbi:hypothetical protein MHB42_18730 [Lysinibacillus sp. FSL K6-0232]|uniref:hypothetical protein n=1 Tax=unclassified Lysinibacillus TaxID=2636778 RepID=UPI0030FAD4C0
MKKKLGCLHAHHSNIAYIEQGIKDIELVHFVDPGLIHHISQGEDGLAQKSRNQIEWIASCGVDAILITCTNYIALLEDNNFSIPIIKIDEPYFEIICREPRPQVLLFTNPATVEGTMTRLAQYAKLHGKAVHALAHVIEHAFELIMKDDQTSYNHAIIQTLQHLSSKQMPISVAQLSMVDAAQQFEKSSMLTIPHPLQALAQAVHKSLY